MHDLTAGLAWAWAWAWQSEYVSEADARRAFMTDFTGSAGTAVVLKQEAYLWTDGRYVLQASQQCDSNVWTIKQTQPKSLTMPDHLPEILQPASKVSYNQYFQAATLMPGTLVPFSACQSK
jgi:Xaa-Pro aminopeptidase